MLANAIAHLREEIERKLSENDNANRGFDSSFKAECLRKSARVLRRAEADCADLEHDRKSIYADLARALILADEAGLYEKKKDT